MTSRLTRHLVWTTPQQPGEGPVEAQAAPAVAMLAHEGALFAAEAFAIAAPQQPVAAAVAPRTVFAAPTTMEVQGRPQAESLGTDIPFTARDKAVYMLHIGAEVEHALMVQYLYAGYSLDVASLTDPEHQRLVGQWRKTILEIAREEMGHLALVENMLTLIGGPLSFARQDMPSQNDLYPFPFELEPVSKRSLAKYVLAECPDDKTVAALGLTHVIDDIKASLGSANVNRVGIIYDSVLQLFTAPSGGSDATPGPEFIQTQDIQADSVRFQVSPSEWGMGYKDLLIATAADRVSAKAGIAAVAEQGEGSTVGDLAGSHFGKFLEIYRAFPDDGGWIPALPVARNPTTDSAADSARQITEPVTALWAGLFNLRYRMLLAFLAHSFRVEAPLKASARTSRGLLVSWAFGEMYNVRSIAELLMRMPLQSGSALRAGPPFEMPYTLGLPAREQDRWRGHRDLILCSRRYVDLLLPKAKEGSSAEYLRTLRAADDTALGQVLTLIGG